MHRRDFLKMTGLSFAGFAMPSHDISWPDGVETSVVPAPVVGLSLDDGWNEYVLREMMGKLWDSEHMSATWFLVGQALTRVFDDATQVGFVNRGQMATRWNEIGYHSMHHLPMAEYKFWTRRDWHRDFLKWKEAFDQVFAGVDRLREASMFSGLARAPYGLFTDEFLAMCEDENLTPVGWSNDLNEWKRGRAVRPGQILMAHIRISDYVLMDQCVELNKRGLHFTTVSSALRHRDIHRQRASGG